MAPFLYAALRHSLSLRLRGRRCAAQVTTLLLAQLDATPRQSLGLPP